MANANSYTTLVGERNSRLTKLMEGVLVMGSTHPHPKLQFSQAELDRICMGVLPVFMYYKSGNEWVTRYRADISEKVVFSQMTIQLSQKGFTQSQFCGTECGNLENEQCIRILSSTFVAVANTTNHPFNGSMNEVHCFQLYLCAFFCMYNREGKEAIREDCDVYASVRYFRGYIKHLIARNKVSRQRVETTLVWRKLFTNNPVTMGDKKFLWTHVHEISRMIFPGCKITCMDKDYFREDSTGFPSREFLCSREYRNMKGERLDPNQILNYKAPSVLSNEEIITYLEQDVGVEGVVPKISSVSLNIEGVEGVEASNYKFSPLDIKAEFAEVKVHMELCQQAVSRHFRNDPNNIAATQEILSLKSALKEYERKAKASEQSKPLAPPSQQSWADENPLVPPSQQDWTEENPDASTGSTEKAAVESESIEVISEPVYCEKRDNEHLDLSESEFSGDEEEERKDKQEEDETIINSTTVCVSNDNASKDSDEKESNATGMNNDGDDPEGPDSDRSNMGQDKDGEEDAGEEDNDDEDSDSHDSDEEFDVRLEKLDLDAHQTNVQQYVLESDLPNCGVLSDPLSSSLKLEYAVLHSHRKLGAGVRNSIKCDSLQFVSTSEEINYLDQQATRLSNIPIVGISGLPGSGKSTIARQLHEELGDSVIVVEASTALREYCGELSVSKYIQTSMESKSNVHSFVSAMAMNRELRQQIHSAETAKIGIKGIILVNYFNDAESACFLELFYPIDSRFITIMCLNTSSQESLQGMKNRSGIRDDGSEADMIKRINANVVSYHRLMDFSALYAAMIVSRDEYTTIASIITNNFDGQSNSGPYNQIISAAEKRLSSESRDKINCKPIDIATHLRQSSNLEKYGLFAKGDYKGCGAGMVVSSSSRFVSFLNRSSIQIERGHPMLVGPKFSCEQTRHDWRFFCRDFINTIDHRYESANSVIRASDLAQGRLFSLTETDTINQAISKYIKYRLWLSELVTRVTGADLEDLATVKDLHSNLNLAGATLDVYDNLMTLSNRTRKGTAMMESIAANTLKSFFHNERVKRQVKDLVETKVPKQQFIRTLLLSRFDCSDNVCSFLLRNTGDDEGYEQILEASYEIEYLYDWINQEGGLALFCESYTNHFEYKRQQLKQLEHTEDEKRNINRRQNNQESLMNTLIELDNYQARSNPSPELAKIIKDLQFCGNIVAQDTLRVRSQPGDIMTSCSTRASTKEYLKVVKELEETKKLLNTSKHIVSDNKVPEKTFEYFAAIIEQLVEQSNGVFDLYKKETEAFKQVVDESVLKQTFKDELIYESKMSVKIHGLTYPDTVLVQASLGLIGAQLSKKQETRLSTALSKVNPTEISHVSDSISPNNVRFNYKPEIAETLSKGEAQEQTEHLQMWQEDIAPITDTSSYTDSTNRDILEQIETNQVTDKSILRATTNRVAERKVRELSPVINRVINPCQTTDDESDQLVGTTTPSVNNHTHTAQVQAGKGASSVASCQIAAFKGCPKIDSKLNIISLGLNPTCKEVPNRNTSRIVSFSAPPKSTNLVFSDGSFESFTPRAVPEIMKEQNFHFASYKQDGQNFLVVGKKHTSRLRLMELLE